MTFTQFQMVMWVLEVVLLTGILVEIHIQKNEEEEEKEDHRPWYER